MERHSARYTRFNPRIDMNRYRKDFPILNTKVDGKPLIYIDNGASTQKPQVVIDAEVDLYSKYYANVHRGLHTLSEQSTAACDEARAAVQSYIGAEHPEEIVFTYGTTMGINLVAYTWAHEHLKAGDEIIISLMEHHANIVPWQELAKRKRIKLLWAPLTEIYKLDYEAFERLVSKKTKLISLVHVSNVLGVENNIDRIVHIARKKSRARVLIDAAQSIAHMPINVAKQDVDFMVFSGHKMYGPTGIGVLYGKKELLEAMPPFLTGGDMILEVTQRQTSFQGPPARFEAGTPNIAGIIGLGAAIGYIESIGLKRIQQYEHDLTEYAYDRLDAVKGLRIYGHRKRHGVLAFNLNGIHAHDVAELLNRHGIAIRSGNHCAMPLHRMLGIVASARASLAFYNTEQEIDALVEALKATQKFFK